MSNDMTDQPTLQVASFNQASRSGILSPPNMISIIRVIAIPFIYWFLKRSFDHLALGILGLALLSDAMDGYLARRFHWQSNWGLIFDPLADKLLIGFLAVFLVIFRDLPLWMACFIISRDLAIVIIGIFLFFRPYRLVVPANRTGKMTTVITSLALLLYFLDIQPYGLWCIWVSAACILGSGIHYTWNFIRLLKNQSLAVERISKESSGSRSMDAVQGSGTGA